MSTSGLIETGAPPAAKVGSSLGSVLGALTAILTLMTGILYFTGYLFLTGYYGRFNLPVNLLGLSVQTILTSSAVLLVPLAAVCVPTAAYFFNDVTEFKSFLLKPWFYLIVFLSCVVMAAFIPPTGRWFADAQLSGRLTAYSIFSEPLPWVSVECKQPVPGMPGGEPSGKEGTAVIYKNLRLVGATEKYFYLYSEQNGSFLVPHDSVSWMRFDSNQN